MNVALIHDKLFIKDLWEQKIAKHDQRTETEDMRKKNSSLTKLRDEWHRRLENRTKHLKKLNDELLRKSKLAKQADDT
ncbi:protein FAM240B [Oncorhynchus tshawytscha]|uniref:protein FAM240B n=1 Tax=Oncorhynchus tshawytscha TaxID=74940 RepID=UPI000D099689|nr:protein FAM240B [Oncorhynchus tshawytscha]